MADKPMFYKCLECGGVFGGKENGRYTSPLSQSSLESLSFTAPEQYSLNHGYCSALCTGTNLLKIGTSPHNVLDILVSLQDYGVIPPTLGDVMIVDESEQIHKGMKRLSASTFGRSARAFSSGSEAISSIQTDGDTGLVLIGDFSDYRPFLFEYFAGRGNGRIVPLSSEYWSDDRAVTLMLQEKGIISIDVPGRGKVQITKTTLDVEVMRALGLIAGIDLTKS